VDKVNEITQLIGEYLKCSDEIDRVIEGKSKKNIEDLENKLQSIYIKITVKTNRK